MFLHFIAGRVLPVIEMYPSQSQTINVGDHAFFQCRATEGEPAPTITWKRYTVFFI